MKKFLKIILTFMLFSLFLSSCGYKTDPSYYDNNTKQTDSLPFVENE